MLFSQHKVSLVLRDGDTITGFGKINYYDKILFWKSMDDEKMIYDHRIVKRIMIFKNDELIKYDYKIVHGYPFAENIRLLNEPIVTGKKNLYSKNHTGYHSTTAQTGAFTTSIEYDYTVYYISNKSKDNVTYLHLARTQSKKFKKLASTIFVECQDTIEKIKSNYFGKEGIVEIVAYYNKHCKN